MTSDIDRVDPSARPISPAVSSTSPPVAPPDMPSLIAEQWAVDVCVRIKELRGVKEVALAAPSGDPARRDAVGKAVDGFLDDAYRAVNRKGRWTGRVRGPLDRWRGTSVVIAYQSLHAAEVFLIEILPEQELRAIAPEAAARALAALSPTDPHRLQIERLPQMESDGSEGFRSAIRHAVKIGYDASDRTHVRVRNLRNMLLLTALAIALFMAALVLAVAYRPEAMPLCFASGSTTAVAPSEERLTVCPSGDQKHPSSGDVLIVAGLGLLGGAVAAAFSIRNMQAATTPYDVPIALALLKPPLGALTAVTSILLLGGNFVPGLSQLDSQRQILAYALVFGYAQQLVSRLIDNQAHSVLESLPSKPPDASRAAVVVAPRRPTGATPRAGATGAGRPAADARPGTTIRRRRPPPPRPAPPPATPPE